MPLVGSDISESKVMQYEGIKSKHAFLGLARQSNKSGQVKKHYLFQASGEYANEVYKQCLIAPFPTKCTRLDVQLTIPKFDDYWARPIIDAMRLAAWPHAPRKVDGTDKEDGLDTIYIGSRESLRFIRIYVKPDDDDSHYIRFEPEFKGDLSNAIWMKMRPDESFAAGLIREEVDRLPSVSGCYFDDLRQLLEEFEAIGLHLPKRVKDDGRTIKWLRDSVTPAVERMAYSHDYGGEMERILMDWFKYINNIQRSG